MERLETEWKKYPVIRLDMSRSKDLDDEIFAANMDSILGVIEKKYGIKHDRNNRAWGARLTSLIYAANEQTGEPVVVLVDEYDAPVLKAMGDTELLKKIRTRMRYPSSLAIWFADFCRKSYASIMPTTSKLVSVTTLGLLIFAIVLPFGVAQ